MIKHMLTFVFTIFVCINISYAETISMDWLNSDNTIYQTTTCNAGEDVILPPSPEKRGYTFKGWALKGWKDYTLLEYIESTGTQYIDTGIKGDNITTTKCVCIPTSGSNTRFFGARGATYSDRAYAVNSAGTNPYIFAVNIYNMEEGLSTDVLIEANKEYTLELTPDNFIINEQIKLVFPASKKIVFETPYTMILFGGYFNNNIVISQSLKVKSFEVIKQNNVIQNLIPAKRNSDNKPGMLDLVSGQFFTNQGTGEFIAGPAIGE